MWRAALWWAALIANLSLLALCLLVAVFLADAVMTVGEPVPDERFVIIPGVLGATSLLSVCGLLANRGRRRAVDVSAFS